MLFLHGRSSLFLTVASLLCCLLLLCIPGHAFAEGIHGVQPAGPSELFSSGVGTPGPNRGGTLIVHHDVSIVYTMEGQYCGGSSIADCDGAITRIDSDEVAVVFVLAAFPENSVPRLLGVTFGVDYSSDVEILDWSQCGDLEIPMNGWPGRGEGTALAWTETQQERIVEVYWFAARSYTSNPGTLTLGEHPNQGGFFADDSVPAKLDPIAGFGSFGFYSDGTLPCPEPQERIGACCFSDGRCSVLPLEDCDGFYLGDFVPCDPNPCEQPGACCEEDGSCVLVFAGDCETLFFPEPCDPNPCPQPGACCFEDGSCELLSPEQCSSAGGQFYGPGSPCDPNPCPAPGACCFDDGTCLVLQHDTCSQSGGAYRGEGIPCDPNPCPTGACCFVSGACVLESEVWCFDHDGIFAGGSCEPYPCDELLEGACCLPNGDCEFTNPSSCLQEHGTHQGPGASCDPNPCPSPEEGACCLEGGLCEFVFEELCIESDGDFFGGACDPNPCPEEPGACCANDGACEFLVESDCENGGGSFQGGDTSCNPNPCPVPCEPFSLAGRESATKPTPPEDPFVQGRGEPGPNRNGTLIVHYDAGVVYTDGTEFCGSSELANCGAAVAREDTDESIVIFVLAAFSEDSAPRLAGVTFGVEYPECVEVEDWGACSDFELPSGGWPASGEGTALTWSVAREDLFVEVYWFAAGGYAGQPGALRLSGHPTQGAFFADDSIPARLDEIAGLGSFGFYVNGHAPCPQAQEDAGACCQADGTCVVVPISDCDGDYIGDFVSCDPYPCDGEPRGACCHADGTCFVLLVEECAFFQGDYLGDGIPCDPNPCAQPGACCFPNGDCLVLFANECVQASGVYQGEGTDCDPNLCPQPEPGACCFDTGVCQFVDSFECGDAGGHFLGEGVSCDPNPCDVSACCFDDGTCLPLSLVACSDTGGERYAGDVCDPNPCPQPATGACCFADGTCLVLSENICADREGEFQGESVDCSTELCPEELGACCVDAECFFLNPIACEEEGGVYLGEGVPCEDDICVSCGNLAITKESLAGRLPGESGGPRVELPANGGCGALLLNADGTYENAYAWHGPCQVAPDFGAFAEGYLGDGNVRICSVVLDLTQSGDYTGQTVDVYVWDDGGGVPGAVASVTVGFDLSEVAFWPSVSRHTISVDACPSTDHMWAGYWGNWPAQQAGWYVGADLDGFGGTPKTNIAPGSAFPTGWNDVSVVWGPTQAIGIGVETDGPCGGSPIQDSTWGSIKSLFREQGRSRRGR